MFQKLTYSGTECNNYIYFTFYSEKFDTDIITKALDILPTSLRIKKEPVPKFTDWTYKIIAGQDIDLVQYLEKLIDIFEPKIDIIKKLKLDYNLDTKIQFVIDIDINPESSTPYFGLNKRAINFLYKTNSEIDYDLYKSDTIGVIFNENE
jgi:hypothetical protein